MIPNDERAPFVVLLQRDHDAKAFAPFIWAARNLCKHIISDDSSQAVGYNTLFLHCANHLLQRLEIQNEIIPALVVFEALLAADDTKEEKDA